MFQLPLYPFLSLSVLIVRRVAICVLKAMWHENVNSCLATDCSHITCSGHQECEVVLIRMHTHTGRKRIPSLCYFFPTANTPTLDNGHTQTPLWSYSET